MGGTMVDGAAKYMPDAQSYDRFTREARSSTFAKGAQPKLRPPGSSNIKQVKESSN